VPFRVAEIDYARCGGSGNLLSSFEQRREITNPKWGASVGIARVMVSSS
jgi:hypothetical protein